MFRKDRTRKKGANHSLIWKGGGGSTQEVPGPLSRDFVRPNAEKEARFTRPRGGNSCSKGVMVTNYRRERRQRSRGGEVE